MNDKEEALYEAFSNLLRIKNECACSISSECGLSEITLRQVTYLKTIEREGEVTFSRLAEIAGASKPTVTEMINRCVRMECVYREPCPDDGRIQYIRLTEKGRAVAHAEQAALQRMIGRIMLTLDKDDQDLLVRILMKIR